MDRLSKEKSGKECGEHKRYEIGDKIIVKSKVSGSSEELYKSREAEITDIATVHYIKSGTEYLYELDNSTLYQEL